MDARARGLPLVPPASAFQNVKILNCLEYMLLLITFHTIRATRWRHLLAPIADVKVRRILAVSWIGFAAILIMPLRAGELVRPYMIREKGKVSMAAATGTVGAERVIDGLCLKVLLGVCLQLAHPLSPLPDHIGKLQIPVAAVPFSAYASLLGFVCAFAFMALFYWRPSLGHKVVEKTLGVVSPRFAQKAGDFVAHTVEGLKFLPELAPFRAVHRNRRLLGFQRLSMWCWRGCGSSRSRSCSCGHGGHRRRHPGPAGPAVRRLSGLGVRGAYDVFHDDVVLGAGGVFVFLLYVIQFLWHVLTATFFLLVDRGAARQVIEAETA
jgi:hypothetical protein